MMVMMGSSSRLLSRLDGRLRPPVCAVLGPAEGDPWDGMVCHSPTRPLERKLVQRERIMMKSDHNDV